MPPIPAAAYLSIATSIGHGFVVMVWMQSLESRVMSQGSRVKSDESSGQFEVFDPEPFCNAQRTDEGFTHAVGLVDRAKIGAIRMDLR